ncbi:hypothetical protein GCM10027578_18400 [Spirosoma luteolum]
MAATIRDITYQLRQGNLVALADETGWSVAADPINDAAVAKLLTLFSVMPDGVRPTVLIQNTDQLILYVAKLPDVAYDVVEFSETPLIVVFEQGKNISPALLDHGPEIAVRRALNPDLQRLIGGFGRGLLTIPFEALKLPPPAEAAVSESFGSLPGMPRKARIIRLDLDGGVGFIRK